MTDENSQRPRREPRIRQRTTRTRYRRGSPERERLENSSTGLDASNSSLPQNIATESEDSSQQLDPRKRRRRTSQSETEYSPPSLENPRERKRRTRNTQSDLEANSGAPQSGSLRDRVQDIASETLEKVESNNLSGQTLSEKDLQIAEEANYPWLLTSENISSPALVNRIDRIRTEFDEDRLFASDEYEFSDDTHDLGNLYSSDYYHFLGQYE